MSSFEAARRLFAAGRATDAVALVERAAEEGDVEALHGLAQWRLFGLYGPRDPAAAHALLARAEALGHHESVRLRAALLASGAGRPRDDRAAAALLQSIAGRDAVARRTLNVWRQVRALAPAGEPETLDPRLPLLRADSFLPAEACAYLMDVARPRLAPSFVIDPRTRQRRPHPVRTSSGAGIGPDAEDLAIGAILDRIAALSGTAREQGEPLHILRYEGGQEYRPHLDALPDAANQRVWTCILYLNADYAGGETDFPALGMKVRGRTGDALLYRNVLEDGGPAPLSRHAGLPVTAGAKWIATRWIRQAAL